MPLIRLTVFHDLSPLANTVNDLPRFFHPGISYGMDTDSRKNTRMYRYGLVFMKFFESSAFRAVNAVRCIDTSILNFKLYLHTRNRMVEVETRIRVTG